MNGYTLVLTYYSAINRNEVMIHIPSLGEVPGNYAVQKKPVQKGYKLHNSIYITFFKGQNFRNGG